MLPISCRAIEEAATRLSCSFLKSSRRLHYLRPGYHYDRQALATSRILQRSQHCPWIISRSLHSTRSVAKPLSRTVRSSFATVFFGTMSTTDRDILPDTVKPIAYDIQLFKLELGGAFSFHGIVKIEVNIKTAVKEIVLNAHQLDVSSAQMIGGQNASSILYDGKSQRVILKFSEDLEPSSGAVLEIAYKGTINHSMKGFYRSKYKPKVKPVASVPMDGEDHVMFSTQFESSDARMAFPSFDEPNLKATFDVSIEIPEDQVALSNMPEKEAKKGEQGLKVVAFQRTPVMSTYLLAWAIGDFEYVEDFTKRKYNGKPLPVRVYTTRGLKDQGRFALENCHQVVDYFSEIFKIDYPLPKIDLLAVHEFSHGAMENWGLITYRTTAVLFDEQTSDAKYKNRVAYVVAHELAHQWFGNLVTMDWWNELWLNEGFATWVGWLAIDHFHPDYEVWSQFVVEGIQTAQNLDALRSSHPIEVPVRDALEVEQIFDAISYLKGCSVIRMLGGHLGTETFLNGVSAYLKSHAYGNATTNDLWAALSKESGKNIKEYMDPWILKIGFPVLTVAEEPGQIGIRQSRFLSTGDMKAEDDETLWWIPLGLKTDPKATGAATTALTAKEETLRDVDETFYKLNSDHVGYYRTNYPPARLESLGAERSKLSTEDKIGLIADAAALAVAGQATTAGLLVFVEKFKDETNKGVWEQILRSLGNIRSIFADNEVVFAGLKKFTLQLVSPAVEEIGWEFEPNEGYLRGQLRALLISVASAVGHKKTIAEAQRRFEAYQKGDTKAINSSLRSAVFTTVVREGGTPAYEAVQEEYLSTTSIDGKETCLTALGKLQSTELVNKFLDFQFSDKVAIQDVHTGSFSLAANSAARNAFWAYLKEHWEPVSKKLSGNPVVMDRYLKTTLSRFASHEVEKDIASFFEGKDTKGYDRGLVQVSDTVKANANYKERDQELVLEWLKVHGYA